MGYVILGVVALFIVVIAVRTAMFRPKAQPEIKPEPVELDEDRCIHNLAELIKCRTVSCYDHAQ